VADTGIDIRFLSARDVAELGLSAAEVVAAVEGALRAQGEGRVVLEPREHLVPDPAFHSHFNLLRAYLEPAGVAGVKVVGDYADNYRLGLPSFSRPPGRSAARPRPRLRPLPAGWRAPPSRAHQLRCERPAGAARMATQQSQLLIGRVAGRDRV
jgi:hypothetical protein